LLYADIIVDISNENLDKTYQYSIPAHLEEKAVIGAPVIIPFGKGNRTIKGYILSVSETPKIKEEFIKPIESVPESGLAIEGQLIALAGWIKEHYGGTMNDALRTVIPVKQSVKATVKRTIYLNVSNEEGVIALEEAERKNYKAKARFLKAVVNKGEIDYEVTVKQLFVPLSTLNSLAKAGIIRIEENRVYRNPIKTIQKEEKKIVLNDNQQEIVSSVLADYDLGIRKTYLIHGVTGSGKTEVYLDIIEGVIRHGKQVIMLIPEIALTFQTVSRFYRRFGDRIAILNSKMSKGERYDQSLRAKNGEIDIMIGPRSALFTPFQNLGLIIIDEEHEGSYKSEMPPKYHAREVAVKRAKDVNASVVLGSATPSLEAYLAAKNGEYELFKLSERAKGATMPDVHIVDLREELKNKNKSMFSGLLRELILDRLDKKEQIMLFLNRRGYAGFVSCRSCGYVMKCSHCDISLTSHNNGTLQCHYCGAAQTMPKVCPKCGSKYIAAFGTGTQKVEEMVKREFPQARVLRMDADTTKTKNSHEEILAAFANGNADILIGTQMIVKGHDFSNVTLVGILAADLSLYASDYRAGERTFQLLAQASGRAGRGNKPGEVVIQTYQPDHYAITAAAEEDYEQFFSKEMNYRKMLKYPPASHIMAVLLVSKDEKKVEMAGKLLSGAADEWLRRTGVREETDIIGPSFANLAKANDFFRMVLYVKQQKYDILTGLKDFLEEYRLVSSYFEAINVSYDFDPMNGY